MSAITDWAAKEQADLSTISTTLDGVVAGIAALDAKIVTLQGTVTGLTPEEQAALDDVAAASNTLVAKAAAISTDAP